MRTPFLRIFILLFSLTLLSPIGMEGRKIKTSYKLGKEKKKADVMNIRGREIPVEFPTDGEDPGEINIEMISKVRFAGYEKEANSSQESFIMINESGHEITGFKVRIDYLDMNGRMLHSRIIERPCQVPAGENRKFDIASWDTQKTYYYHLGNEPKKVASPYKVAFLPQSFWIEIE